MRYRADHIIEGHIARLTEKGKQERGRPNPAGTGHGPDSRTKSGGRDLYDIIMGGGK